MGFEKLNDSHGLTVQGSICHSNLRRNPYTISLMNEGMRAGLLTIQELMRIQNDFMPILQELIRRYTQGESTSVPTETAESILISIMYASDAYLRSLDQPEKAIASLKSVEVRHIYEKGVEEVELCFQETRQLYMEVKAMKLDVPVDAYNMTIDESLPLFLRKYGIIFEAHHTMTSIDYPLAIDDMGLQGVFYVKQYLERLKMETQFCAKFNQQQLLDLLAHYGRECRFDYRIELFNMYELVLSNAIFSILSGGDAADIRISETQYERLERLFMSLSEEGIRSTVTGAMGRLQQDLAIEPQLQAYMDACREELIQRLVNAAKHDSLRTVIIMEREARAKSIVISFNEEDRMSDVRWRQLLQEVKACETNGEKVQLIMTHVHAFHDYLDMLESDCLYGEEYEGLFEAFGDTELAILANVVFYEELRSESLDLWDILELEGDYPMEWQRRFASCLHGMDQERLNTVNKLMDEIDYEQLTFY